MEFDYIVVGSGAAGSVVARRLSDDVRNRVLLVERGRRDRSPMLHIPLGMHFATKGDRYVDRYETGRVGGIAARDVWVRGSVLGGSTAVNGMMWVRGHAADFDGIEALGNPGWGWDRVLGIYKELEDNALGASDTRGAGGPYGVGAEAVDDELSQLLLASANSYGWNTVEDFNSSDATRISPTPVSIRNGRRTSSYSAFVRPVLDRGNLTVLVGVDAGFLLFDGTQVVGIRARRGGSVVDYKARKEVVVCAGTIESTLLLERSGIGNPEVLLAAGVRPRIESPNLGERVIEQRVVRMQLRLSGDLGLTNRLNSTAKQGWEAIKYLAARTGPLTTCGFSLLAQFKSSPDLSRPDLQAAISRFAVDTRRGSYVLPRHSGVMIAAYPIRPETTSSIHICGALPQDPPSIEVRTLEVAADRAATAKSLGILREAFSRAPMSDRIVAEDFPGAEVSTGDDVVAYALRTGGTICHAVGAAAMGPDETDVVDANLRVRGVGGLRVADASIFPVQPAGNTAAPVTVAGWIAADAIMSGG